MSSKVPRVYYNNDPDTFAFATCQERWPIIIQNVIDDVEQTVGETENSELVQQGETILSELKELKFEVENDGKITKFNQPSISGLDSFDDVIESLGEVTWFTAPWLFSECYLYRRFNCSVVTQPLWKEYDIFNRLKQSTFESSSHGVAELAIRYKQLHEELKVKEVDEELLELFFDEFVEISLWGNATDLSLLANATFEDIKSVQGAEARKKSEKNILANDVSKAWSALLKTPKEGRRVDFVLDNSGFELYADLMLILFLLDAKVISTVVLHCKDLPWMVSDVMLKDFQILIDDLKDATFFPDHREELEYLAASIEEHFANGSIQLQTSPFWTSALDFWNISADETKYGGAEVHKELLKSDLVIFKGDLNYRKLSGDRKWVRSTPFVTGIGKLATSGVRLLSLRTCKADVCLGLEEGKDEELSQHWKSLGNKVGELWCASGKWAVMSFSEGK